MPIVLGFQVKINHFQYYVQVFSFVLGYSVLVSSMTFLIHALSSTLCNVFAHFQRRQRKSGMYHLIFLPLTPTDINAGATHFSFLQSLMMKFPSCPIQVSPSLIWMLIPLLSYSWDFDMSIISSGRIFKLFFLPLLIFPPQHINHLFPPNKNQR